MKTIMPDMLTNVLDADDGVLIITAAGDMYAGSSQAPEAKAFLSAASGALWVYYPLVVRAWIDMVGGDLESAAMMATSSLAHPGHPTIP